MNISLPYSPFHYQTAVHKDATRFRLVVAGRRAGKTKMAFYEALSHCLSQSNRCAWWIACTYRDAKEIGWALFLEIEHILAPAIESVSRTELKVRFTNGSVFYFKGSDNPNALRGRGLTFVVIDEAAFQDEDVWKKVVRPALSDRQGRAILISSPNGRNWFWEQYSYAIRKDTRHWKAERWPTSINPIISPEDLEDAKRELSDMDYRQEYLAEFVTKAGMVYSDFSDENILDTDFTYNELEYNIYLGADFGYANPSAIVFVAVSLITGRVIVFNEIYESRKDIHDLIKMINDKLIYHKIPKRSVSYIATDPAGNAEELTSGISPVDTLRMDGGFEVINRGTRIIAGLSLVRSYIKNALGERRLFVCKNCKNLISSMYGYTYKRRNSFNKTISEEPDKDGIHDHACDALRYFFVNTFDENKYVATEIKQQNYLSEEKAPRPVFIKCASCGNKFLRKNPGSRLCSKCQQEL